MLIERTLTFLSLYKDIKYGELKSSLLLNDAISSSLSAKSTCSPDGSYLFSGSEEGEPKMWQLDTGISYSTSKYECGFIDSVNDVSWNSVYNMNALSGFGQEYIEKIYENFKIYYCIFRVKYTLPLTIVKY